MSEEKLKPCPFCGSSDISIFNRDVSQRVLCKSCDVSTYSNEWSKKLAIEMWNTRAALEAKQPTNTNMDRAEVAHKGDQKRETVMQVWDYLLSELSRQKVTLDDGVLDHLDNIIRGDHFEINDKGRNRALWCLQQAETGSTNDGRLEYLFYPEDLETIRAALTSAPSVPDGFKTEFDLRKIRSAVEKCSPINMKYFSPSKVMEDVDGELFNILARSTSDLVKLIDMLAAAPKPTEKK